MAIGARKPCAWAGCSALVAIGQRHCAVHKAKAAQGKGRSVYTSMYADAEYRRLRAKYLKQYPLCVQCGANAVIVDHIVPHKGNVELFMGKANWQGLCKRCHDSKTSSIDGGFGNTIKHHANPMP